MSDESADDLDGLPPKVRAEYNALSSEVQTYIYRQYARYAMDLRATQEHSASVRAMLAESPPNLAGARELLGMAPDTDLVALLAELQHRYDLLGVAPDADLAAMLIELQRQQRLP